jgi:hypothetical protein
VAAAPLQDMSTRWGMAHAGLGDGGGSNVTSAIDFVGRKKSFDLGTAKDIHGQLDNDISDDDHEIVGSINYVAYVIVANIIVVVGIIGNILNLIVLTRPKLKGVMYVYLLGLAVSNLCVLFTAIPALINIAGGFHSRAYATAFFEAHLDIPMLNSFMASSVYIIICMTVNRYISIYRPTQFQRIHTFRNAYLAIAFSFVGGVVLHVPLAFEHYVDEKCFDVAPHCEYSKQQNDVIHKHILFRVYIWVSETLLRFGPIITLTLLNILIIVRFRRIALKREVLKGNSGAGAQHRGSSAGTGPPPSPYFNGRPSSAAGGASTGNTASASTGGPSSSARLSFSAINGRLAPLQTCGGGGNSLSVAPEATSSSALQLHSTDTTLLSAAEATSMAISRATTPVSQSHIAAAATASASVSPSRALARGTPTRVSSRRRGLHNPEERMLVVVLIAIVILFVVCTTPAAILSLLVTEERKKRIWFAIFRAVANNLELLCFALNFFVYCLCSADIRCAFMDVLFQNGFVAYLRRKSVGSAHAAVGTNAGVVGIELTTMHNPDHV